MDEKFKYFLVKVQDVVSSWHEHENGFVKKASEGANQVPNFCYNLVASVTKEDKKCFQSLLCYVEQTILKPWSDSQDEFIVLTCHENDDFDIVNFLSVLSALAYKKGDTAVVEEVQGTAVQYQQLPGAGFLMNNLGVMLSENVLYEKSEECFDIAKKCFNDQQDHLREAVVTLNMAALHRALGNYQRAQNLCDDATSLCHDISMRTTKEACLPAKLLRRVADMLKEFGSKKLFDILRIGVHYDISGASKAAVIDLTKQLMKFQYQEEIGENISVEEVEDFISHLLSLLNKPDGELMNAEFIKTVIISAKFYWNTGHHKEACNMLKKLDNSFLLVHGGRNSLYGSLLYQIGCFLHGSGKFGEAESVLKQAEEILIRVFGRSHHAVASCKSFLGFCVLLKGNTKEALKHLKEALTMFKNLNPNHPEVGEILLKLAFSYVEEGKFQYAQEAMQKAEGIFLLTYGEESRKTASAYFQLGMILQKIDDFRTSAVDKIEKAIQILFSLRLNLGHPDVKLCSSILGVLQLSLGLAKEAKEYFIDVQNNASLCEDPCSKKAKIIAPEITNLHLQVTPDYSRDGFSSLEAQVISLVNLVRLTTGDGRVKYLDTLASCLEQLQTVELQACDFAGQQLYFASHRVPVLDRPVLIIISSDLKPHSSQFFQGLNSDSLNESESANSSDSDIFLLSSAKKSHFLLFSRIPHKVQEIKDVICLTSSFRESVNTLFLQPKFRKGYLEGKDFYMELPVPADLCDISSLCRQIDCLPLLVELELSESQEQCDNFDYLTSWESSVKSVKSSAHVSYFSFKCSNQRETEFVFDHLVHSLDQNLALNKVQAVVSNLSPLQNAASFFFQEPRNSSLSVVVDRKSVLVKCRTIKESETSCVCSSVRNALVVTMGTCQTVGVNFESSAQLTCEGVSSGLGIEESLSRNCNLGVPSWAALTSGNLPCASPCSRDAELELKRKATAKTVDMLRDENVEVNPTVSHPGDNFHADVDACLCLLSCLLSQSRSISAGEEASNSCAVSTSSTSGYESDNNDVQVNQNHSISSSLSLHPVTPSAFPESGEPFAQKKSSSDSMSSVSKMKEHNQDSLADQNDSEISMYRDFSSHEEVLTMTEDCPGLETIKAKHLEDLDQLQTSSTEVNKEESFISTVDEKGICKRDTKSSIVNDSELPSTKWYEDLYVNQNQQQNLSVEFPQSIPGPSSAASSEKIDAGTLTDDCLRPLLANLEDELSAFQKECLELQQQKSQLEEQLKQSEEEIQNLQADLGRYLFLEEKEKRHERLLGGAAPVQDPGFSLHARLLEISNSLSAEEVKRIKFLAKSKVNSFRLARLTEAFELFEELETRGEFPCDFIGKLLVGIQRYDLVEKLGIHVPLPGAERGSDHPPEQSIPDRKHELPDQTQSMPTQGNSMDVPPNRHDRERHLSNGGNRNDHMPRMEETDYNYNQYASISSSGSSNEAHPYTTEEELTSGDMAVLRINAESDNSSLQSTGNAKECTRLPNSSDDGLLSDSSCSTTASSSDLFVNCTMHASSDSTDGSPMLTSVNSHSAFGSHKILSDSGLTPINSEEENLRSSQTLANGSEESEDKKVNSTQTTQAAASNCPSLASSNSSDGSPLLTTGNSHSAFGSDKISSDSGLTPTSSEEENLRSSQMLANGGEESEDKDVCDGAVRTVPLRTSTDAVKTETNSPDISTCGFVRTQSGANVGNIPWSQQGAFPSAEMAAVGAHSSNVFSGTTTEWERQGARPKQGRVQHSLIKQIPGEPFIPVTDGLAGDFLARHTQDKALHDSLYQSVGTEMPLFNDTPSQGASYIDGVINIFDSNKAKPYLGDCQAASGTDPYSRLGASGGRFDERDISYSKHLNNNTGPLPSHLGGNYFSVSQRNPLNTTNSLSLQSGFVLNNSRFSEHVGGAPHLPLETQQGPFPSVPSSQFVNSGVTGSSFSDLAWNSSTVGTQSGHPVYGAQRYTLFNNNTSTLTSSQSTRQTPQNTNLTLGNHSNSTTNNENVSSSSARNILHEDVRTSALPAAHAVSICDPTRTTGLDSTTTSRPSLVCHSSNTTTVGDGISSQGSASGTSIPEPSCGNADSGRASVLNNRDFGTDSVESPDNCLLALEQRVSEACALVERVLREREEREQFGREIERKEQLIREQRARERREREEREIQEAERWPQQQEAITARSQWLCEHYQRHCRVRFPCCTQYYPCHRCHNISKACDNEEAKACHASHLKCSHCQHEQEIGEDSEKCRKCGGKMSAYFCSICKHFTSIDKNPYHCEKCGICRIHKDKSFHCEVCNVCLDKRLQGNHKCRPDSGHDECCICLEDAFSGCQILPCSHKVHRECAIAMIQNGMYSAPVQFVDILCTAHPGSKHLFS